MQLPLISRRVLLLIAADASDMTAIVIIRKSETELPGRLSVMATPNYALASILTKNGIHVVEASLCTADYQMVQVTCFPKHTNVEHQLHGSGIEGFSNKHQVGPKGTKFFVRAAWKLNMINSQIGSPRNTVLRETRGVQMVLTITDFLMSS